MTIVNYYGFHFFTNPIAKSNRIQLKMSKLLPYLGGFQADFFREINLFDLYLHCGNYGKLSQFFDRNFVKTTFLTIKLLNSKFDGKMSVRSHESENKFFSNVR